MSSATHASKSQKDRSSIANDEQIEEEVWSGEENDADDRDDGNPKRKRVKMTRPMSVSCETCKQRKVKCDRGHPQCGWCLRNSQICEYKERKKPGLRAGYGRELESRLDQLEQVLQNHHQVLQQLTNSLPGAAVALTSPVNQSHHGTAEPAVYTQTPNVYSNTSPVAHISESIHDQVSGDAGHARHASQNQAPSVSLQSPNLDVPGVLQGSVQGSVGNEDVPYIDFPPYDLVHGLTQLFFKHVNTWCPILHQGATMDSLFGHTALEEADRILLHAIIATTLRFSTDSRLSEQSRSRYHDLSKQKVLLYGMENSSVKSLQALVILALDIVGNSNGPPGFNLLAVITRSAVQLGLAVETTSTSVAPLYASIYTLRAVTLPEPKSFIEDESRRRLFWMIYLLDRYATIATAFNFSLDDNEIDRKLPCRDDLFSHHQFVDTRWFHTTDRTDYSLNKPENLGSFAYYVEIIGILSQIHLFLKKPVDIGKLSDVEAWQQEYRELDNTLSSWKSSLPSEYGDRSIGFNRTKAKDGVDSIWIMLHITYHTTVIRLHSSAAYPTTRSTIFTPSYSASQRCLTAVEDICGLCTYVRNNNMVTKLGPPFAFSLWVAARLLLVHGSTIEHQVNPAIVQLVETLRELGYYWKVAERYATLLQRVLDEYNESERAPIGANGVRETPSSVRILADMRRNAFDLDFFISRQPRQYFGSKVNTVTPARTPGPNELEYLDVFDFFNMPRLPFPVNGDTMGGLNGEAADYQSIEGNEFNITNFMYDANSDWFGNPPK